MLYPTIYKRESGTTISNIDITPRVTYSVQPYSWHAIGGPMQARIDITAGDRFAIWDHIEMLRCPIEIRNEQGERVWWGYVSEVQITEDAISIGVSLDTMVNRVAVVYSYVEPGTQTVGQRRTTAWVGDADSIAEYGTKELLVSTGGMSTAGAENRRAQELAIKRLPIPIRGSEPGQRSNATATIYCTGWFWTLGWRYYASTNTTDTINTTQISTMVSTSGQFLTATDIENATTLSSSAYRDGDSTALDEIRKLLRDGTTAGRLLASVTPERRLRVYQEPASGASDYYQLPDGTFRTNYNLELPRDACVAGVWTRLDGVIPASADVSKLANPALAFIEEMEYDPASGQRRVRFRDQRDVFDFGA